jgi:hypothetical protein
MVTPPEIQPSEPPKPRRGGVPLVLVGGAAALVAGLGAAWMLLGDDGGRDGPPPAAEGGLVIDTAGPDDGPAAPGKPLRCFVQGQYVGELSLADCAQRNGVATDALDVGLDETGALAAADQAGQTLTPLPPVEDAATVDGDAAAAEAGMDEPGAEVGGGTCWRHGGGRWRKMASGGDIDACVQALYAGRCERPGGAAYGRYGQQTLRLVTGRVEISDDNRTFRTLVNQGADCSIPPVG